MNKELRWPDVDCDASISISTSPEPAPETAVIEGGLARHKDMYHGCNLHLFTKVKPERRELMADWVGGLSRIVLDSSLFPSITWESEPRKARIEITLIDDDNP